MPDRYGLARGYALNNEQLSSYQVLKAMQREYDKLTRKYSREYQLTGDREAGLVSSVFAQRAEEAHALLLSRFDPYGNPLTPVAAGRE